MYSSKQKKALFLFKYLLEEEQERVEEKEFTLYGKFCEAEPLDCLVSTVGASDCDLREVGMSVLLLYVSKKKGLSQCVKYTQPAENWGYSSNSNKTLTLSEILTIRMKEMSSYTDPDDKEMVVEEMKVTKEVLSKLSSLC